MILQQRKYEVERQNNYTACAVSVAVCSEKKLLCVSGKTGTMGIHRSRANGYAFGSRDNFQLLHFLDGNIGYNMARNVQAKLPSSDTIRVFDINADSVQKFANETKALGSGAAVKIAVSAREAAEDAVSLLWNLVCQSRCYSAPPHMMNLSYP